uniref:FLYWCH-type domain-containing protein n=1 Tax=Panagrolaimus davidi TaxID=227884 RepID=A0A914Q736_9BILA
MDTTEEDTFAINDRIKVTDTQRKKPIAQIGGYEYKFAHAAKTTGKCYWRCTKYVTLKCAAVIYTNDITEGLPITEIRNKHNHAGDALAPERRLVRNDAHRVKNFLPSEHPSIWRFFEVMKEELVLSMNHAAEADRSASQRPKYVKISADLQRYQQK